MKQKIKSKSKLCLQVFHDEEIGAMLVALTWSFVFQQPVIEVTVGSGYFDGVVRTSVIAKFDSTQLGWDQAQDMFDSLSKTDVRVHLDRTKSWRVGAVQ